MKQKLLMASAIVFLLSCSKNETAKPEANAKAYTISLGLKGELNVTDESPLSSLANKTLPRSVSSTDLLGVQVYSRVKGSQSGDLPYAYGLFDNNDNTTINLVSGNVYRFEAMVIKEGKTKIHSTSGGYWAPFNNSGPGAYSTAITPNFIVSSITSLNNMSNGYTWLANYGPTYTFGNPSVDRYYGIAADYEPSQNGALNIAMKRVVFGAKFVAPGLTSGRLKITMGGAPDQFIETTTPNKTIQDIYSFSCASCASLNDVYTSLNDVYTEVLPVAVKLIRADGVEVPVASGNVTFKRKTITTVNINITDASSSNKMSVSFEQGDLSSGSTIDL
ncbi:hypothetical protein ACLOAU_18270 [Niabella sp. CJ426]|uniref:hypothetical protein n=1 Tax=Niabella sp. CJ426 TaxID=3393740 RepID=UPI003D088259